MSYAQMHDGWDSHPKFVRLMAKVGGDGPCTFWRAVSRCNMHLTDGEISLAELLALVCCKRPMAVIAALVDVGLVERLDGETYQLHDYLDWQSSRELVERKRAARKAAGAVGGQASGRARRPEAIASVERSKAEANASAIGEAIASRNEAIAEAKPKQNRSKTEPRHDHDHVTSRSRPPAEAAEAPTAPATAPGAFSADWLRVELRRFERLAGLAGDGPFVDVLLGRAMSRGPKPEWLAEAISEAAGSVSGAESPAELRKLVRSYCDNARAPRAHRSAGPIQPQSSAWAPKRVDDPACPLPMANPGEALL